jgi:hypothetical protein
MSTKHDNRVALLRMGWRAILWNLWWAPLLCWPRAASAQWLQLGLQTGVHRSILAGVETVGLASLRGDGVLYGAFMRYGRRPFYQIGFQGFNGRADLVLIEENDNSSPTSSARSSMRGAEVNARFGYYALDSPAWKWRFGIGAYYGASNLLTEKPRLFSKADFRRPQWGLALGTGVDFTYFHLDVDYQWSVVSFFHTPAWPGRLNAFSLKLGMQI